METDAKDPRSKTILVVDDDVSILDLFELALVRDGFNAMRLPSGDKVVQIVTKKSSIVDLIILDLMLPGKDGITILKELQKHGVTHIPIFIVTAKALPPAEIEKLRREPNVKEFFQKPVDVKKLKEKAHEILGTQSKKAA